MSGLPPAELLMGRRPNDKLPRVTILREKNHRGSLSAASLGKRRVGKTLSERIRRQQASSQYSDIVQGDRILLNKSRDNKLSPKFEPVPYKVVKKKGNAVLIEDQEGNTKLRNASYSLFSQVIALKPLKRRRRRSRGHVHWKRVGSNCFDPANQY